MCDTIFPKQCMGSLSLPRVLGAYATYMGLLYSIPVCVNLDYRAWVVGAWPSVHPQQCVCVPVSFATPACARTSNGAMDYPLSTLVTRVTTAILGCSPLSLCAAVTLTASPSSDVCRQWCGSAVGQWWVCHSTPRRGHTRPLSHDGGPAFGVGQATQPPETPAQRGSHLSFGVRGNDLQIGIV